MAGTETMASSEGISRTVLILTGVALVIPLLLVSVAVLAMEDKLRSGMSTVSTVQPYAKSFHIVIREQQQNIHMWARNLDTSPDFRQVIEVDGKIVSQQVYRYAEKTIYTTEQGSAVGDAWKKTANLEPKDIGIDNITGGPAVWALQYGVGESQVTLPQGTVSMVVKSINQPFDDKIFQPIPEINLDT